MDPRRVAARARKLGSKGYRGWVTPQGEFFESDKTPEGRILGLELGGHERAALDWLEKNRPDLALELENEAAAAGYETFLDTDGLDVIKNFMFKHGFYRVAPD